PLYVPCTRYASVASGRLPAPNAVYTLSLHDALPISREGACFIADGLPDPDGRIKIVCQNGTPEQIEAFREWAEHRGLVDFYGDPARGIAGAYEITAPAKA